MKTEIFYRINETLRNMHFSLKNYKEANDQNKILHLKNFITSGRSVTFVIQNLKSHVGKERFDEWYNPWVSKMSGDKILKTFITLRNEIEKQGKLDTSLSTHIEHLNTNDLQNLLENPPPYAKDFFIGDQIGGSGWEVDYGNGIKEKIYVELPQKVKMSIDFEVNKLSDLDISMSTLEMLEYYTYLYSIYFDAKLHFS